MIFEVNRGEWYTYPRPSGEGWVRVQVHAQYQKGGTDWVSFDSVQIGFGGSAALEAFLRLAISEPTETYQERAYQNA